MAAAAERGAATWRQRIPASTADFIGVIVITSTEAVNGSMLLPYVGILVTQLSPGMREADAGMVSGLVVGCFQLAQAMFGSLWGTCSDKYGRKPIILVSLVLCATFGLGFGLSRSISELFLFRFLYGATNCTAFIGKTIIAEIIDPSNEGRGWAALSVAWAVGGMAGPVIGGLLFDPAKNLSPSTFGDTVFDEYPGLLPALISSLYTLIAAIYACVALRETNPNAKTPAWVHACWNRSWRHRRHVAVNANDDDDGDDTDISAKDATDAHTATELQVVNVSSGDGDDGAAAANAAAPHYSLMHMIRDPPMATCLYVYVFASWVGTTFQEVMPLLAILPKSHGGLGVHAAQIGFIFMIMAIQMVIANLFYPAVLRRFHRVRLLQFLCVTWGLSLAFTPLLTAVDWPNSTALVLGCSTWLIFRTFSSVFTFSIVMAGIGATAPRRHLGQATALSHSCGNVARGFLPPLLTAVFSWSVGGSSSSIALHKTGAKLVVNKTVVLADAFANVTTAAPFGLPPGQGGAGGLLGRVLGPGFPFNRWFVFLIIGISMASCALATSRLREHHLVRQDGDAVAPITANGDADEGADCIVKVSAEASLPESDSDLSAENEPNPACARPSGGPTRDS